MHTSRSSKSSAEPEHLPPTNLWTVWFTCVQALRPAFKRARTYLWVGIILLGFCVRGDLAGVTSWVRAGFLTPNTYYNLLHVFRTPAVNLGRLTQAWVRIVLTLFHPLEVAGHLVAVADGLKVPKEGKRMPGVKSLHQESQNNTKAPYIMGHSFQAVGLLVKAFAGVVCVPLASRLHEGVKAGPGEKCTLLDKLVALFLPLASSLGKPVILVADAYYATRKVVHPLLAAGHHLVTRVRSNAVAYRPASPPKEPRRGRKRVYGAKVRLRDLWKNSTRFITAPSPVYEEKGVTIRYHVVDLLWRPGAVLVRFVLVDHPTRGRLILMTSLLTLDALEVVRLYGYRFKIEVGFKQALRTIGAYAYHFWMKGLKPIRRGDGDQYLHMEPEGYRVRVRRKLGAYDLHVQLGCIAQGLLQHLAVNQQASVWARFCSWMRTMNVNATPSEAVTAQALRASLPEFLAASAPERDLEKFLLGRVDWSRVPGMVMPT